MILSHCSSCSHRHDTHFHHQIYEIPSYYPTNNIVLLIIGNSKYENTIKRFLILLFYTVKHFVKIFLLFSNLFREESERVNHILLYTILNPMYPITTVST